MKDWVLLDFESQSAADLPKCGAAVYASHPTTQVVMLWYSFNGAEPILWREDRDGWHCPADLAEKIEAGWDLIAHNSMFEQMMWERLMVPDYGWPEADTEQWYCTMASCAERAIPLGLDKACDVLDLPQKKGSIGKKYFKPNPKTGDFWPTPYEMYPYGAQDVRAEGGLYKRLGRVSKREETVFRLDQRINRRGIKVDIEFIRQALKCVRSEATPLIEEFRDLTGVNPTQTAELKKWLYKHDCDIPNLQKETVDEILGLSDESDDAGYIPQDGYNASTPARQTTYGSEVYRALNIRRIVGSASVKKLDSLLLCTDGDFRIRGSVQYHGASTGRWSGRLFQPQNFPRGTTKVMVGLDKSGKPRYESPDPDNIVTAIKTGDYEFVSSLYGTSATEIISSALRHAIIPEAGHQLLCGDFSTVEARIVLAMAGQTDKVQFLAEGGPIYELMAEKIYGYPINKKDHPVERQTGKNSVLGLGFQMGWPKFMDRYAADDQGEDFCKEVVRIYRQEFAPMVPELWKGLEKASLETVRTGRMHESHGIQYRLEDGFLSARIPSGRKLWYYKPRLIRKEMPWDETDIREAWAYLSYKNGRIMLVDAYGGIETANAVQATARDLLVSAMFRIEEFGYPSILTVHDEDLCEVPDSMKPNPKFLQQIMEFEPAWAKGLNIPIAAECWMGDRYRK